jgi:hypothetical protein
MKQSLRCRVTHVAIDFSRLELDESYLLCALCPAAWELSEFVKPQNSLTPALPVRHVASAPTIPYTRNFGSKSYDLIDWL